MEYTPGQVWSILVNGSDDLNEEIDIRAAVESLPWPERLFLILLTSGYPATYAMKHSGLKGNQTRLKRGILTRLTRILNGEEEERDE